MNPKLSQIVPASEVTQERRPYEPRGGAKELLHYKGREVLLSGPAGTGKSRSAIEKLHLCMEKYAGARALMVRKTRASLSESALVTFEDKVVPAGHAILTGVQRRMRGGYEYPNGSKIVIGGMDNATKVMSTEYDVIYAQEAIELSEHDWESLTTRLRNGVMPYQQLMADTNPDTPQHWLKQRCDRGQVKLIESRHEDNPVLYDVAAGTWTEAGRVYVGLLDDLTGARKQRLRFGRWVQAEGVVYEGWDRALHVIERFEVPADWPRYWVVDFGYTNPLVWQAWAQDPDGRLYMYREIYHTQRLVEDHARDILELTAGEPRPQSVIVDHDAEDRATLERCLGLPTLAADKQVSPGIQAVAARLRRAGDGWPRLFLCENSLAERDEALVESHKPWCTEQEFDGYVWDLSAGRKRGEQPLKRGDHGCLIASTRIETERGPVPLEDVKVGERVLTRRGYCNVSWSGLTQAAAEVVTVTFSNGASLTGTRDHLIYILGRGFTALHAVRYGDILETVQSSNYGGLFQWGKIVKNRKSLITKGSVSEGIQSPRVILTGRITDRAPHRSGAGLVLCTRKFGKTLSGRSRRITRFTTRTGTRSTTPLKTCNASAVRSITSGTGTKRLARNEGRFGEQRRIMLVHLRASGTGRKKVGNGTGELRLSPHRSGILCHGRANIAARGTKSITSRHPGRGFAQITASPLTAENGEWTTFSAPARRVGGSLPSASIARPSLALRSVGGSHAGSGNSGPANGAARCLRCVRQTRSGSVRPIVLTITSGILKVPVYDLTVDGAHEYFANGVLVHNCDALRYLVASVDLQPEWEFF